MVRTNSMDAARYAVEAKGTQKANPLTAPTPAKRKQQVFTRSAFGKSSWVKANSKNPLDELPFPVVCHYPGCGAGPFVNGVEVDEHITEEHLPEAVWTFAHENMRRRI